MIGGWLFGMQSWESRGWHARLGLVLGFKRRARAPESIVRCYNASIDKVRSVSIGLKDLYRIIVFISTNRARGFYNSHLPIKFILSSWFFLSIKGVYLTQLRMAAAGEGASATTKATTNDAPSGPTMKDQQKQNPATLEEDDEFEDFPVDGALSSRLQIHELCLVVVADRL